MKSLDKNHSGTVNYPEFEAYWMKMFSGEIVHGEKMAAIMAQFADINHIPGVAYHPDRYVDEDDELRARCWFLFDTIDSNHDDAMCGYQRVCMYAVLQLCRTSLTGLLCGGW
jgi:hypothetical protein